MQLANLDSASLPREENNLSRRYLDVLVRWIHVGMSVYADWPVRPNCGHFFGGVYWYGMETAYCILPLAAAASSPEFDAKKAGHSADELRAIALRGLRYLLFTHDTGPADCVRPTITEGTMDQSGRKWGELGRSFFRQSQCAWTVTALIQTAALIKDLLTDEELRMLGAVAADYIERFGDMDPKTGVYMDTQTEENGWTAMGLASSLSILPGLPNEGWFWHRTKEWMFRTSTVPQDVQNTCEFETPSPRYEGGVTGGSVSAWCRRAFTTLPDFTAENHGFVHPTYMSASVVLAGMTMNVLNHFGRPTPPQLHWHRGETYDLHKRWCDRLGSPHCPQGMDWPYFRFAWPACTHAIASCYYGDPEAALLERKSLEVLERSSLAHGGAMVPEEVKTYIHGAGERTTLWELNIASAAQAYLCHRLKGPGAEPSRESEFGQRMSGSYFYPSGGLVLHNHEHGLSSFSWRNATMALPVTHEGIKLIGPAPNSILGEYKVAGKGHSENNRSVVIRELPDRVSALLIQDLAGDTIRRRVFFCSLPDGRGMSYEVAHALSDLTVESCTLGYLRVINDGYFGDNGTKSSRKLYWPGGEEEYSGFLSDAASDDVTRDLTGFDWINIDDRMGFRFAGTGGASYTNRHFHETFHAVYDELVLGRYPDSRAFKAGEKIAELAVMWLPERDHGSTAKEKFEILTAPPDVFAARVDGWLCACNFGLDERDLDGGLLEPMEPRLVRRTK